MIRAARDEDAAGLIALVGACWAEYPGCVLDVDGEMPHLRRIAGAYAEWGGELFVAEQLGEVVGSVGWVPGADGGIELRMLYVAATARRRGLGTRLAELVETAARERGAASLELWSDTRFLDAHGLYERLGYMRSGVTRELNDRSGTVEYQFRKPIL